MKLKLILILLVLSAGAYAQQRPLFSQYMHNPYLLNPAAAGAEDFAVARSSFRKQWSGFSGAPQSYYLTVQGPLISAGGTQKNTLPMLGKSVLSSFKPDTVQAKPPKLRHGLGLTIISDKMGATRINTALISYALHFKISPTLKASFGASLGGRQWVLDPNALDFETNGDPVVGTAIINKLFPAVSIGGMVYANRLFFGLSSEQIIQSKLNFGTVAGVLEPGKLRTHLYATAGYAIPLGGFTLTPSVMMRYVSPVAPALDVNLKAEYRDLFWVGASYRMGSAMAFLAGLRVGERLMVGYSYDMSAGNSKDLAKNSHEVIVGVRFGQMGTVKKYFW